MPHYKYNLFVNLYKLSKKIYLNIMYFVFIYLIILFTTKNTVPNYAIHTDSFLKNKLIFDTKKLKTRSYLNKLCV